MGSIPGSQFKKERHCPSSQDLASYHQRHLASSQDSHITAHLPTCDFCAAELQLFSKFPSVGQPSECPPMPAALRALAEALLVNDGVRNRGLRRLSRANQTVRLYG